MERRDSLAIPSPFNRLAIEFLKRHTSTARG